MPAFIQSNTNRTLIRKKRFKFKWSINDAWFGNQGVKWRKKNEIKQCFRAHMQNWDLFIFENSLSLYLLCLFELKRFPFPFSSLPLPIKIVACKNRKESTNACFKVSTRNGVLCFFHDCMICWIFWWMPVAYAKRDIEFFFLKVNILIEFKLPTSIEIHFIFNTIYRIRCGC